MPAKAEQIGNLFGFPVHAGREEELQSHCSPETEFATAWACYAAEISAILAAHADIQLAVAGLMSCLTGAIFGLRNNSKRFARNVDRALAVMDGAVQSLPEHRGDYSKDLCVFANEGDLDCLVEAQAERAKESASEAGGLS